MSPARVSSVTTKLPERPHHRQDRPARPVSTAMTVVSLGERGEESLTPRKFLEKYGLPRCAKVYGEVPVLGQRVLLYKYYKSNRVEAVLEDSGPAGTIVIPYLFDGWFSVVTERGQIKAKCFTSIQRLVSAQVSAFLTITDLQGYTLNSRSTMEGKKQQYTKTTVKEGETLKLLAVYQDVGSTGRRGGGEETCYAQCLSQAGQVVYVPVKSTGQFYAVATSRREEGVSRVYQLPRLLKTFPLPVRVCVINGCKAQGSMVLEAVKTEEVILACSLGKENKLLEIDINSKFKFVDHQLRTSDHDIMSALQYTRLNWERWRRQMKIAHNIYPKEISGHQQPPREDTGSGRKRESMRSKQPPLPPTPVETPYVQVRDSVEEPVYAEVTS